MPHCWKSHVAAQLDLYLNKELSNHLITDPVLILVTFTNVLIHYGRCLLNTWRMLHESNVLLNVLNVLRRRDTM